MAGLFVALTFDPISNDGSRNAVRCSNLRAQPW